MMPVGWDWSRRDFLRSMLAALGWGAIGARSAAFAAGSGRGDAIPRRSLGRTGLEVSILGLGGASIGAIGSDERARAVIDRCLDLGVNYLDTAPTYSDGRSERRIGQAIRGRRDDLVLATKTYKPRNRDAARRDLEGSLRRLGTDTIDLWQIHSVQGHDDLDAIFDDDGPIRAAEDAVKAGKVRHVGVTGHVHPEANLRAIREYGFATILMPLNLADPHHLSFVKGVLPTAVEEGLGIIAMKVLAAGRLPGRDGVADTDCLRYAYALPISTAIVGMKTISEVDKAAEAARRPPLPRDEADALVARIREHPGRDLEWYKREIPPRREG